MAHVNIPGHQHGLYRVGQVKQTQQVAGCAARTPHRLRRCFVRQAKFFHQPLHALCFFKRVEVFTLDVLNQGHGRSGLVGHVANQYRHPVEAGQFGGPKAPFASNDLVHRTQRASAVNASGHLGTLDLSIGIAQAAHQNRLHDALHLDRLGQLIERTFVHAGTWLVLTWHHIGQQQTGRLAAAGAIAGICVGPKQRLQPHAQTLEFFCHHAFLSLT
ncbi:hypothetical protein GALL_479350 [mine drainage metagenome]|uniref:Uncharacterized protein n=1 Tax=mine drainage metagenome TaxID=410659 RepID=A0A1J5PYU9_9ZZZZ